MDYEINNDTQVIIPLNDGSSRIIEKDETYVVNNSAFSVLEHSCEYFGSSYNGRKEGTKKLLGITHKAPIIIEESRKIIFFPTSSPDNIDCVWVNLGKIEKYYKIDSRRSAILFKNGEIVNLNVSIGSLTNQILRATRLKFVLEQRIDKKEDNIL